MEVCPNCKGGFDDMEEGLVCDKCDRIYNVCQCGRLATFIYLTVDEEDAKEYTRMHGFPLGSNMLLRNKEPGLEYADCGSFSDAVNLYWRCDACDIEYCSEAD
ncbi:hypothetical protein LAU_0419 [Lausannevirus]|uniref:Uncharacterized protein n=2 Tax=Lausannevirus TaxID=999883 RepID=A0A0N9Q1B2_9VIRU|nr:hypothetical protein LAU_0419 [Lausannevirus]AEA07269.1 hypothetical protein LAU_0419 [Lausannevirus]ALH07077.1 hypothetical protein PMV_379 [Port-miou virus]